MNRCITLLGISLLIALPAVANADETARLSDEQEAQISLIQSEIQAQIRQLEQLEAKLIAAIIDGAKEQGREAIANAVVPMAGSGLIGNAKVDGEDSDILFLYEHGKIFNPEPVRSRIEGNFVLTLNGQLEVPRDMVVQVWHAGGGVSHDVNTLIVDDQSISSVGDDRSKSSIDELTLKSGSHSVRWQLTGGTFRHNLLKFVDPASGELLTLGFDTDQLPDVRIREFVRVGSDEHGWPIPNDWTTD